MSWAVERYPTKHFTILESQNTSIPDFFLVKRRSTEFEREMFGRVEPEVCS